VTPRLSIRAVGMASPVGLDAPASIAALRARLDGFQETRFVARGGDWLIGAEVPLAEPWRGVPRLARLVLGPIRECLAAAPGKRARDLPLLVAVAEPERPGRLAGLERELQGELEAALDGPLHPESRFVAQGRVGVASAVRRASELLAAGRAEQVIVAGVDGWLAAETLRVLDERHRLLTPRNSNGFIPGEAAAALLVTAPDAAAPLHLVAAGFGVEPAAIESGEPLRGEGLAAAFRQALAAAGIPMARVGWRIGTMSGEQYWFKEHDLAVARLLRGRHEAVDLWHPADGIGETGAASLACCLVLAFEAARKGWAPGDPVLVAAANDDGRRAALLLAAGAAG
jgi:3-oxoacyl-[acyl-carrier-protein] synthase-1